MPHQPQLLPDQPSPDQAARNAERAEYPERLREKLKAPEFRAIEGFPISEDKDTLALSNLPYYTACPNPFLPEIIALAARTRPTLRRTGPPRRFTLHYTALGDIISDGFCGTGMTGVAAQLCGDQRTVESLADRQNRETSGGLSSPFGPVR